MSDRAVYCTALAIMACVIALGLAFAGADAFTTIP
jgi:hypothetical protein